MLGGHLATMCGSDILQNEPFVDYILKGDAEFSILDFIKALFESTHELGKVSGLIYRNNQNKIIENPQSLENVDLDKIPWCERDDLLFLSGENEFDFSARIISKQGLYV